MGSAAQDGTRTGVCVVRAERHGTGALRITVIGRADVCDGAETVWRSLSSEAAALHVLDFLEAFDRASPP